jgi:beta-lactamase regulating signal transducer with metallopeptidase domain/tetratricopeptide (TPR) repeat protein
MTGMLAAGIGFAADIAWKATILFSVTALVILSLKRSGAAARHFAGIAGLAGALALPLLALSLPRFEIPLLPPLPSPAAKKMQLAEAPPEAAAVSNHEAIAVSDSGKRTEAVPIAKSGRLSDPVRETGVAWLPWALGAWAAGALLLAARLTLGLHRVRGLKREAEPIRDLDWRKEADRLSETLAVRRTIALYESPRVPVAITSGLFRPFLLLCRQARSWAAERRRVVLLHEIAHVRRGDWIWLVLAEVALAVYWWHPLAWLLTRQVRRDGEKACDDLVLAAGTKPSVYAGHLLGIFRSLSSAAHPVAPAVASARPSHFEGRLRAILDPSAGRRELPRARAALSAAALIVSAAGISAVSPWEPARTEAAVLRPFSEMLSPTEVGKPSSASAACPFKRTAPARASGVAVRTASPSSTSATAAPASADLETISPEEALPESGRTLPAILRGLDVVKTTAGEFVRASKRLVKAGRREGAEWYSRAMELHNDGRYDEAIAAFEKAIEAGYREDTASYNIACGYARKRDRDKAFEWLRKAEEEGFDVASYLGRDDDLDSLRADPRWKAMKADAQKHPSPSREREAAAAVRRYERITASGHKGGEAAYESGKELLKAGRYDLSAKAFADSAARGYRVGASLYNQACALSQDEKVGPALDMLQKALDAGFDQPDLLEKDDDLDNVRSDPRFSQIAQEARALALPGYGTGRWMRSSERVSRWREAARRFEQYARAHPNKGRAWFNLGFASLAGDRPEAAVEAFGEALKLDYRKPTTLYNLACSYARLDQKDQAFDFLFKALDAGFDATGTLRGDEDLDALRGDPRFRKALEIARAREKSEDD